MTTSIMRITYESSKRLFLAFSVLVSMFVIWSCKPIESDKYQLAQVPPLTSDMVDFTVTPEDKNPNIINLRNVSSNKVLSVLKWDLGNGANANTDNVQAKYPRKGDYKITLTLYGSDGSMASKSKVVKITQDSFELIDTPMYRNLTGGIENDKGKTWVFDQYHDGHFGVGPAGALSPEWWSAPAEAKKGSSLYTQKFTFIQDGLQLKWENNGYIYTNAAGLSALGITAGVIDDPAGVGDYDVPYLPKSSYTFVLDEDANTLTLSEGAFLGHYTGNSTYRILVLSPTELYVSVNSSVEDGNGWWYRLVPEELNVEPLVSPRVLEENDEDN